MNDKCEVNTDVEIWRKVPGDYYSPSIHVTEGGGIGINVGGNVFVMPVEDWHAHARRISAAYVDGLRAAQEATANRPEAVDAIQAVIDRVINLLPR
jgi:hypothetical protein